MEKKKCNQCFELKSVSEFGKESRSKNGFKSRCKKCLNAYSNKFYRENKSLFKEYTKKYYLNNKDFLIEKAKVYAAKNKNKKAEYMKNYWKKNKDDLNKKANEREKNRYKTCKEYAFIRRVRKMVSRLKEKKCSKRTEDILKYTYQDFKDYIGRDLENGEEIDHKIPVSWFVSGTCISIINSLENLQILTKKENVKKSNTYADPISASFYKKVINKIKKEYQLKINIYEDTLQTPQKP